MSSLKEIAGSLGVSHALVSRVLNNKMGTTRVSDKVRKAILQKAKELDYQPNPLALALKKGQKGVVGVFLHGVGVEGSELSLEFIQAAGKALSEHRLNLWLQFFETEEEFSAVCNEKLLRKVDGLIVAGLMHESLASQIKEIEKQGLHVASACQGPLNNWDIVNYQVNPHSQCYLPAKHLIEKGCRKIAHFNTTPYRYAGFLKALTEAAVPIRNELVASTPNQYDVDAGRSATKYLLDSRCDFDGLVAQSDAQAVGAMMALSDAGIPMSKWPLITGVDNSPIAKYYGLLPITSTTAEMSTCARLTVDAITKKIAGSAVSPQLAEPSLVVRRSSER